MDVLGLKRSVEITAIPEHKRTLNTHALMQGNSSHTSRPEFESLPPPTRFKKCAARAAALNPEDHRRVKAYTTTYRRHVGEMEIGCAVSSRKEIRLEDWLKKIQMYTAPSQFDQGGGALSA